MRSRRRLLIAALAGVLAACAPPSAERTTTGAPVPEGFPEADYRQAEAQRRKVLRVDSGRSLVAIEVHRSGTLARLGHDHVVASHDVRGYVATDAGRADLYVRLDELVVDEPELRAESGLDAQVSAAAIDGTRRNMLDKVLEADRHPFALIHVANAAVDRPTLALAITLHGTTRAFEIPARIEPHAGGLTITGRMALKQTDFGIVPFSVLGGALQVQDEVDLRFRIVATDGR